MPSVLVIDEVGYTRLSTDQARHFFEQVNARYEHGSIILTSNTSFARWGSLLGDEVLATALLDRLLHHAEGIPTNVVSMMINQSLLQQTRRNHRTPRPKNMWSCPIIHFMDAWSGLWLAGLRPPMSTAP